MTLSLPIEAEANALLNRSPVALLSAMLLDQQVAMEWAFAGPLTIARRLDEARGGGTPADQLDLDANEIAAYDPEAFAALLAAKPAVHRYPGSMGKRIHQMCVYLVERYAGDAAAVWRDAATGAELFGRLNALPGYGKQKAQIFVALLGKQFGVTPDGWREAAGAYGEEGSYRSVADVTDRDTLERVRSFKQQMKAAAKTKS
jgi:uncharacterized HhH-GPD family protein